MTRLILAVFLAGLAAHAAEIPFHPGANSEGVYNGRGGKLDPGVVGTGLHKVARATYDYAALGGSSAAAIQLGVSLPANSVVKQAYFYTVTQVAPASTKFDLKCGSTTIYTATDVSGIAAGTITATNATGTAATMIDLGTSACALTAQPTVNSATAGKMNFVVEYFSHD